MRRIDADRCVAPWGPGAFIAFVTQACGLGCGFGRPVRACGCCLVHMSPHPAREAGPLIDHAATSWAAAEVPGDVLRRGVVLRQVQFAEQFQLLAAEAAVAGDAADRADGQVQAFGDFSVANAGAQQTADGGQVEMGEAGHGEEFQIEDFVQISNWGTAACN